MAFIRRDDRMAWLNRTCREEELLQPLPPDTFKVKLRDQPTRFELVV